LRRLGDVDRNAISRAAFDEESGEIDEGGAKPLPRKPADSLNMVGTVNQIEIGEGAHLLSNGVIRRITPEL
jgi:hypothetical protein